MWLFNFRRRDRDRNMQVEVPLAIDQFGGAEFALSKLFAHPGGHLQPAGDAAFVTDRQRDGLTVRTKSHRSGVVSQGRMQFELMCHKCFTCERGSAFLSTQNEPFMGGVSCAKKDDVSI